MMIGSGATRRPLGRTTIHVAIVLSLAFALLAGAAGYWGVAMAPDLVTSPDDAAVIAAARTVTRGLIKDRTGKVLASNKKDANGESHRVYIGRAVSQVVGYASSVYGRAGLERSFDAELTGLSVDPLTDAFAKFGADRYDPQDLTLSLSYDLQRAAVTALGQRRGAIVMLDPRNGEVLALASTPTYDASAIADPATAKATFEALQADPAQPLLPRATLGRYVPGSVFKIVTAVAGLGSQAITPATTYKQQPGAEKNGLLVDGYRVRDGHHPATGSTALDLTGATEVSCNIYYALTGLKTGGAQLVEYAKRMGFGAPLPFDLPTAVSQVTDGSGSQPGGFKDDVELANAAYGQAETFVTPLQMALVAVDRGERWGADASPARHGDDRATQRDQGDRSAVDGPGHLAGRRPGDHDRDGPGRRRTARTAVHGRRQGPGRDHGRQVGHGRAGWDRRASLVVHRLRPGRRADHRHRRHRRAGRPRR